MQKILLFDLASDGHHKFYAKTIIQGLLKDNEHVELRFLTCPTLNPAEANNIVHESLTRYIPSWIQAILAYMPTRIRSILLLLFVLSYARILGYRKIHFLYLDCCILALLLFIPFTFGLSISGTLHRFPAQQSKSFILTILLKFKIIRKLMVHGEYTRAQLIIGREKFISRIESLIYPNLLDLPDPHLNAAILEQLKPYRKPILLAFGGLRYE